MIDSSRCQCTLFLSSVTDCVAVSRCCGVMLLLRFHSVSIFVSAASSCLLL